MENKTDFISGASAAIRNSIKQLEQISKGVINNNEKKLRKEFRDKSVKILVDLSIKWYRIGFKRGHKTSYLRFKKSNAFPKTLNKEINVKLLKGKREKKVVLKSKLKKFSKKKEILPMV